MNWLTFSIFAYIAYVLEVGLRPLLSIPGSGGASPSFLLILAVFIGLSASPTVTAWAFLILGLIVDLQGGPVVGGVVIGPAAVGFLVGAYALLQLRTLIFRESVMSLAVMVFVVGVFTQLVIVAFYTLRGVPAEAIQGWDAAAELVSRFLNLLYTMAWSLPLGYLLMRYSGLWGFTSKPRADRHYPGRPGLRD